MTQFNGMTKSLILKVNKSKLPKRQFHTLIRKILKVAIIFAAQDCFDGAGVILAPTRQALGSIFVLLAALDDCCSLWAGGLKTYSRLEKVIVDTNIQVGFKNLSSVKFSILCRVKKCIDFIDLVLDIFAIYMYFHKQNHGISYRCIVLQPVTMHHKSLHGSVGVSLCFHICYDCQKIRSL